MFDAEILKVTEEQLSGPCTEEMASFDKFVDFLGTDEYEVIVFDTAPTGHTIRLLELPVDWSRHIEDSAQGSGQTCMGPVALIQESKQKYDQAVAKLRDRTQTEFIFVMQPEQTSLEETIRASEELATIEIHTTGVIVNGLIPVEEAASGFFKSRYELQQKYLRLAQETFVHLELRTMELFSNELKGVAQFRISAQKLFPGGGKDNRLGDLLYPAPNRRKMIFFSGKGGVGKTTLACLTAVHTAERGYKTLLMTTDPAAHTGTVLDQPVTDEIQAVQGKNNLYAVKIDQKKVTAEYKESVLQEARGKFAPATVQAMEEELNSPCTEEMAAFQKFMEYAGSEDFQVTVFDTAPTGHTLRLLELPMDWSKQIELKAGAGLGVSEADRIQQERFQTVISLLRDEEQTTFGFVMYPEKTPLIEAYRASQELAGAGIKTNLIVANLIIPEEAATTPFFQGRRDMQLGYLEEIRSRFSDAYLLEVPMQETEIKGLERLHEVAERVFTR